MICAKCCFAALISAAISIQSNEFDCGICCGYIDGKLHALNELKPFIEQVPSDLDVQVVFLVKTDELVVYKVNNRNRIGYRE